MKKIKKIIIIPLFIFTFSLMSISCFASDGTETGTSHSGGGGYNSPILIPDSDGYEASINSLNDIWNTVTENIESVKESLEDLLAKLDDIEADTRLMAADYNYNMHGLPISQAIGSFRFMVGEVIFSTLYLIIVLGILATIFTICYKIYKCLLSIYNSAILPLASLIKSI